MTNKNRKKHKIIVSLPFVIQRSLLFFNSTFVKRYIIIIKYINCNNYCSITKLLRKDIRSFLENVQD